MAKEETTPGDKGQESKPSPGSDIGRPGGDSGEATPQSHNGMVSMSKAEYDQILSRLEKQAAAEAKRKEAAEIQHEAELREQGKFKDLHEQAVLKLTAATERLTRAEKAIDGIIEDEMKLLPETFDKTLIPDLEKPEKLTWIRKMRAVVATKTPEKGKPGERTPPAGGTAPAASLEEAAALLFGKASVR